MAEQRPAVSYPFAFDPPLDRWARAFAIVPTRSFVLVDDNGFEAIYGSWRVATDWSNVAEVTHTGPYTAWKIAGPTRLSIADRGLTMAATTEGGVCLAMHRPVRGIEPFGILRHPGITLGVADPDAFVADVEERMHRFHARFASSADAPTHPKGKPLPTLRSVWHWRQRPVVHDQRDVERITLPANDRTGDVDDQPVENGAGPTMHRRYEVRVRGADLSAEEAMASIQADPSVLADPGVAPFTKSVGTAGSMTIGDRYVIQVYGPWKGAVEVIDVTPRSLRLSTLEGHMESGVIEMRVEEHSDELCFTIESFARSHDQYLNALYNRLRFAYVMQSEMWATALDRFTELVGGEPAGPLELLTERATRAVKPHN